MEHRAVSATLQKGQDNEIPSPQSLVSLISQAV